MKISLVKKWKRKQQKFIRKFSAVKRFKQKRGQIKRKYVLLLSRKNKKCGAVLKFINRKRFRAMWAVPINQAVKKQTSRKFMITPKRNWKVLKNVEVIVSSKFKEQFLKVWTRSHDPDTHRLIKEKEKLGEILPKITPIKIISCKDCNHKFTSRKLFDEHTHSHIDLDSSSDESEKEMVIDDDVELILDFDFEDHQSSRQHPENLLNLKEEPKADEFCCMMNNCEKVFTNEDALIVHIGMQHESEDKAFPCKKCNESFTRESGLLAHSRIVHPLEIIEPLPLLIPTKVHGKSHFFTMSPPPQSSNDTPKSKISSKNTIKFKRYDSKEGFICRICSVSLEQRLHLDRHITVHHISKVYFCYKCHNPYQRMQLLNHLKTAHLKSVHDPGYISTLQDLESVSSHRCPFCRFTSKERNRVDQHMTQEHYDEFEKGEFNDEDDENDHVSSPDSLENLFSAETIKVLRNKEEDEDDLLVEVPKKKKMKSEKQRKRKPHNDPTFKFRCARCQRRFSRKKNLLTHICVRIEINDSNQKSPSVDPAPKRHSAKSQMLNGFYNCSSCSHVFTDKALFNQHVSSAHSTPKISSSSGFTSGYSS
jgi:Zinc finger, C2H2 type